MNSTRALVIIVAFPFAACSPVSDETVFRQTPDQRLAGEVMAVAYSGFREGKHPDRGEGAANPSPAEILEAFDEPWKGDPDKPRGAEKHWGLFNVDRTPKQVFEPQPRRSGDP